MTLLLLLLPWHLHLSAFLSQIPMVYRYSSYHLPIIIIPLASITLPSYLLWSMDVEISGNSYLVSASLLKCLKEIILCFSPLSGGNRLRVTCPDMSLGSGFRSVGIIQSGPQSCEGGYSPPQTLTPTPVLPSHFNTKLGFNFSGRRGSGHCILCFTSLLQVTLGSVLTDLFTLS